MQFESADALLAYFRAGDSVFIAGSSAEPRPVVETIGSLAAELPGLEIVHSFVPGINTAPLAGSNNSLGETAIFPRRGFGPLDKAVQLIPTSYYGYNQYLAQRAFDWAIVQLSPPDAQGRHCLGPTVEFLPAVLRQCKHIVGVINPHMPSIPGSVFIEAGDLTHTCDIDEPLVSYDAGTADAVSRKISDNLATLVDDGSTLQLGLGKVPARLLDRLTDRRNLRFHTGLLTEGFFALLEMGALYEGARHNTCACLGSAAFYDRLAEVPGLNIAGVEYTHAPATLTKLDSLIAINSALEVDLRGQANLEFMGDRQVSSVGGAPDFARAARGASNGRSIIALPATAAKGTVSRIVPELPGQYPVSIARQDIDYVVTEYGIATLTGKTVAERATALSSVAAPAFQEDLERAINKME